MSQPVRIINVTTEDSLQVNMPAVHATCAAQDEHVRIWTDGNNRGYTEGRYNRASSMGLIETVMMTAETEKKILVWLAMKKMSGTWAGRVSTPLMAAMRVLIGAIVFHERGLWIALLVQE
jgi:hypothetical protein